MKKFIVILILLFIFSITALAIQDWINGLPEQTDNTNIEWVNGLPYIRITKAEAAADNAIMFGMNF